ncbi:hypothetical protein [Chitinophaga flava]|uniref:Uncharacterized protein n=1 Tax=Chitinophaga flava TaxID=2259036 RepID=A0A365XSF8_9BACT|nr:hypothetical protein [Chitinophaga flava]RBL89297.1 hypothetical protein DF182_22510 [Chitinophaga flava]
MSNAKRLTLDDFQLEEITSGNEIDKMLGLAAAGCHVTGPHTNPDGSVTLIDYEWGAMSQAPNLTPGRVDVPLTIQ